MNTVTAHPAIERLRSELADIERDVEAYGFADALREGAEHAGMQQMHGGFINDSHACAISIAILAATARD